MSGSSTIRDLHSGVLHKVGGRVKTWHKRWMIIRSDYCLYYYKDPNKLPQGSIPLRDTNFSVRDGIKGESNWPKYCDLSNTLVLTTSTRTYYMFAETLDEANEWKAQLKKAVERMKEEDRVRSSKTRSPGEALSGTCSAQAAQLNRPEAVESSNTPKMYKKKDRRMPTKRFQEPSSVDDGCLNSSDSDIDIDKMLADEDGELYRGEYDQVPSTMDDDNDDDNNILQHESLYDLVGSADADAETIPIANSNTVTSPPPIDRRVSQASSNAPDVHESLYDLVAMINADDSNGETIPAGSIQDSAPNPPPPGGTYELVQPTPPAVETYEPVASPSSSILSQSVKGLPLPIIPSSEESSAHAVVYEELDSHSTAAAAAAAVNLYEDIDKRDRVEEADSDEEEAAKKPHTPAPGPPLPSRNAGPPLPPKVPECDDTPPPSLPPRTVPESVSQQQTDAPFLPPKPDQTSAEFRLPPTVPTTTPSSSLPSGETSPSPGSRKKNPSTDQATLVDESVPEGEDVYDDIQGTAEELYEDTLSVTKPRQQDKLQVTTAQPPLEQGDEDVYDDTVGVLQQQNGLDVVEDSNELSRPAESAEDHHRVEQTVNDAHQSSPSIEHRSSSTASDQCSPSSVTRTDRISTGMELKT